MSRKLDLLLVGCGNMGAAILTGYLATHPQAHVAAIDPDPERARARFAVDTPISIVKSAADLGDVTPRVVILAVKPQALEATLPALRHLCADALVLSIAAGFPLARLSGGLDGHDRVIRAMPNLPATVGLGATTLYAEGLTVEDQILGESVFCSVGRCDWLETEAQIDMATAVAGSGPAYVFALVEQLAAAGAAEGLPASLAMQLARQTVVGAAALLQQDDRSASELKTAVTSPGGTTAAGLAALEADNALPRALHACVAAAHQRARELAT